MMISHSLFRIIERFQNTIVNQFYGHTHKDEFKVFYDTVTGTGNQPISFGFVTPSVTPHTNVNMAYRIYTIDGEYEGSTRVKIIHIWYFCQSWNLLCYFSCRGSLTMSSTLGTSLRPARMRASLLFTPFCTLQSKELHDTTKIHSKVASWLFLSFFQSWSWDGRPVAFRLWWPGEKAEGRRPDVGEVLQVGTFFIISPSACNNWVLLCRYYISDSVTRGAPDDEDRYDILCEAITTDSENDVKCRVWTSTIVFPCLCFF